MVTGHAPVTLELRNTLGKNTNNPRRYPHSITADVIHASTRKILQKKGNRESVYDVPGPYWSIRLTTCAWKTRLYRLPTHTRDRCKSIGKKKQRKKKEENIKERKEKIRKRKKRKRKGKERKEKSRKARKDKTKRGSKGRKREKNVMLADPRN